MDISSLEIANLNTRPGSGGYTARLCIRCGDTRIHLHVKAQMPKPESGPDIVDALINDGLRQLRRMPGYRRGERDVQITPQTAIICEGYS